MHVFGVICVLMSSIYIIVLFRADDNGLSLKRGSVLVFLPGQKFVI